MHAPFSLAHNTEQEEENFILARQSLAPAREESAREEQQFQNAATAAWLPYCEVLK